MGSETTAARQPLPRSIYAETARAPVPTPKLDMDRGVDVAVIGGGFTGLSAALHLAERKVGVAILEAHEPGWGASGRNGGQVNPGLKHDPDDVEKDFGPDLGRRMVTFSGNAPNVVFDLIRRYQIACEARQNGTIRAAYARKPSAGVRRMVEQCMRRNMPVELLERDTIAEVTGTDRYACGILDRRGGCVNPLGYARGLAQAAQQAGASIYGGTPVLGIARNGAHWRLQTPLATVTAERLVIGTNAYTDDIWPSLRRSLVPVYSAIIASEPMSDEVAGRVMPSGSVLYEDSSIPVYYRLDAQNRLLMGGRSPMHDVGDAGKFSWMQRYSERLFPALKGIGWTHCWNGRVAITIDHYPHLHEPVESALLCVGYNGRGVALSTAMGDEIARRITGTPIAELNMPVTTLKEIPFHGLWKMAARARIISGRIRDFLQT